MIYVVWYLAIGLVVLAVVFISHRISRKWDFLSKSEILDALIPERMTLKYKILTNIVAPVLTAIFILAAWPVAIAFKGNQLIRIKRRPHDRLTR